MASLAPISPCCSRMARPTASASFGKTNADPLKTPLFCLGDNQIRLSRLDCIGNQIFERSGSIRVAKYKVPDVSLVLIALSACEMNKLLTRISGFGNALEDIIMGNRRMMVERQPNTRRVCREHEPEIFARIIDVTFPGWS